MTLEYAISILHAYQKWLRSGKGPQPDPKIVGQAIDTAIRLMRAEKKLLNLQKSTVYKGQTITIKN